MTNSINSTNAGLQQALVMGSNFSNFSIGQVVWLKQGSFSEMKCVDTIQDKKYCERKKIWKYRMSDTHFIFDGYNTKCIQQWHDEESLSERMV